MRTNADPERGDALLDALLQDETWQTANAAFKAATSSGRASGAGSMRRRESYFA